MTTYTRRLICCTIMILFPLASLPLPALAQEMRDRKVQRILSHDEPVRISQIKIQGVTVEPGKEFKGDQRWISGLTLSVTNTSDKAICFINIALDFTRAEGPGQDVRDRLVWGCRQPATQGASGFKRPKPLAPGESLEIALSKEQYDELQEQLRRTDNSDNIDRVDITVDEIGFEGDDDTMWSGGQMMRRDRNNPNHWYPMKPPEK